jgi:hypothetical protein
MKKILLAVAIVLSMSLCSYAQYNSDNFFMDWNDVSNGIDNNDNFGNGMRDPGFPGHNGGNTPAPLGSGLIILGALGAGYAVARRKREK